MHDIDTIKTWLGSGSINIFGLPFVGKDTQCVKLADLLGGVKISGGDVLRHQATLEEMGPTNTGDVAPSELYLRLILPYLSLEEFRGKPFLLSTVGRSHGEEPAIIEATERSGHPMKAVVFLNMSEEEVWKRYEASKLDKDRGSREDDDPAVLQVRLDTFHNNTMQVIEYYRDMGLVIELDGSKDRESVTNDILAALAERARA